MQAARLPALLPSARSAAQNSCPPDMQPTGSMATQFVVSARPVKVHGYLARIIPGASVPGALGNLGFKYYNYGRAWEIHQ